MSGSLIEKGNPMRYRPYLTAACLLLAACSTQPSERIHETITKQDNQPNTVDSALLQAEQNARNDAIFLNQAVPLKEFFNLSTKEVQSIDLYVINVHTSARLEKPEQLMAMIPQNHILMTNGHASVKTENIPEIIQDISNIRAMPHEKSYAYYNKRLLIRIKYHTGEITDILTMERQGYVSFLYGYISVNNQNPVYVNFSLEDINQIFTKTNPELTVFQYK